jgi:hypothetical protein
LQTQRRKVEAELADTLNIRFLAATRLRASSIEIPPAVSTRADEVIE